MESIRHSWSGTGSDVGVELSMPDGEKGVLMSEAGARSDDRMRR